MPHPLRRRSSPPYLAARDLPPLLGRCSSIKQLLQVHSFIVTRGFLDQDDGDALLRNLIGAASSLGFSDYAQLVSTHNRKPSTRLSNAIINSLSHAGLPKAAVLEFSRIRASGLRPDSYSFPFALRSAARLRGPEPGRQIHGQAIGAGFDSDVHVATALVQFYSGSGLVSDARKVFDEMYSSGFAPLWNAMIAGLVRAGQADSAAEMFDRMPKRDVISWNTLIAGLAQLNRPREAINTFRRMQIEGPEPDEITISALLSACAELGALELGEWARSFITRNRIQWTVPINNALIDMYSKSGKIDEAIRVFSSMERKSVISWTTMISGLALNGMGREALEMFDEMERAKVPPNEVTFLSVLSACCHSRLVGPGFEIFYKMRDKYSIEPKIEHYGCMIDLLGRAGHLRAAEDLLENMPFMANPAIWGSLLSAARTHVDIGLGERALRRLADLEPENAGNFTLLANIYSGMARWGDSGTVRKALRDIGSKKKKGWSSVEVDGEVHEFAAEDGSHFMSGFVFEALCRINGQLKLAGDDRWDESWG